MKLQSQQEIPPRQTFPTPQKHSLTQEAIFSINQTRLILNHIPPVYKYLLPISILTINIMQLQSINLINSYSLSMDPAYIFSTKDIQLWRVWSYLLAIDSAGCGVWDVMANVGILMLCGYCIGKRCVYEVYKKDSMSLYPRQLDEMVLTKSEQQVYFQQETTKIEHGKLFNPQQAYEFQTQFMKNSNKLWRYTIFIQSLIITLYLSLVNCFIWFVWTHFGPHTFVSTGLLPMGYWHFIRLLLIRNDKENVYSGLGMLPFKIKSKYMGVILGVALMVFSMQAQSILLVMMFALCYKQK